jgi:uncharacterized protein (DUF2141 family)
MKIVGINISTEHKVMKALSFSVLIFFIAMLAGAQSLTITVSHVDAGAGPLMFGIFNSEAEFPDGNLAASGLTPGDSNTVIYNIDNLSPGTYAVAIYQDNNENGQLDKSGLGIPKEPYGFSGSWKRGAADFDEASFDHGSQGTAISVRLR